MERLIPIAIGYFLGCILTADFVARARLSKSAFEVGSRNPGMANIGGLLGAKGAALVLAGDIAKVIIAVVLAGIVVRFVRQIVELVDSVLLRLNGLVGESIL